VGMDFLWGGRGVGGPPGNIDLLFYDLLFLWFCVPSHTGVDVVGVGG